MWKHLSAIAFLIAIGIAQASAQAASPASDPGLHTIRQPYDVETFGAFRMLIQAGDFSPKVTLAAAMARHPTTGMGALSDARGEITIYDGKLIVSYGKPGTYPTPEAETAALLSISSATGWQTIDVAHDVRPNDIEGFISQVAVAHGLNPEGPFPFQIRGTLTSYVMHVNSAPTNGPHGMGQPIAITVESKGDTIDGAVAGIYVSRDLIGIVTHGGARTHNHWISPDGKSTAHLDSWGLKTGSVLMLPKPSR